MTNVLCECGQVSGVRCEWTGAEADTVLVEWMPAYLRESHEAAGNRGVYPHNGATRLRVQDSCAEWILESEGDWAHVICL